MKPCAEVISNYMEPWRAYHNMLHIGEMFDLASRWGADLNEAQILAIWYHDAVMDPLSSDNEARSAELLWEHYGTGHATDQACRIIWDTKSHVPSIEESKVVLDLDMAILGADVRRYRQYVRGIRQEYENVPLPLFVASRSHFLQECLDRADTLFYTEDGQRLKDRAVHNMSAELRDYKAYLQDQDGLPLILENYDD